MNCTYSARSLFSALKAKAAVVVLLSASSMAMADGYYYRGIDGNAVIGGAVGGGAGAAVGSMVGGRDGAIIGGALGAATGVAIAAQRPAYRADYHYHDHHRAYTYARPGWGKYKLKHHGRYNKGHHYHYD